jgi:hypothetical protein
MLQLTHTESSTRAHAAASTALVRLGRLLHGKHCASLGLENHSALREQALRVAADVLLALLLVLKELRVSGQRVAQHAEQLLRSRHSNAPRHGTTQQNSTKHSTAQHSTAQHSTAQHSTAQHSTAQHSTAQHSTAQHSTST